MIYPLVNVYITMGNHYGKSPFLIGKSTINGYFQWLCLFTRGYYIYIYTQYTYNYIIYICMEHPFWKPPKIIYLCLNLDSREKIAWFNQQQQGVLGYKNMPPPRDLARCQLETMSVISMNFIWIY